MEISFTRFRIYLECPWKYKLKFADGRDTPLDPPSSLGVSLHRALERFHRAGDIRWESLVDAYDHEFLRSGYDDVETRMRWNKKGLRILERYYESELSRRTEIVGIEREFTFELGAHAVRGMIDRIDRLPDGRFELIDYKTRFDLEPDQQIPAPDKDLQLRFYALGVKEGLAIPPSLLTVHYLAAGKRKTAPYDSAGEEDLKRQILEAADGIEAARFGPDTSFCPRCVFKETCSFSTQK